MHDKPMYLDVTSLKSLFHQRRHSSHVSTILGGQNNPRRRKRRKSVNQQDDRAPKPQIPLPTKPNHVEQQEQEHHAVVAAQLGMSVEEVATLEANMSDRFDDDIERYRQVFDEFDVDKSGAISSDELQTLLQALGDKDIDIDDIMARADADGNGQIDFEEFIDMVKARKRLLAVAKYMGTSTSILKQSSSQQLSQQSPLAALPPLKMATMQSKKHMKQYNRYWTRPTPSCLRPGANVDLTTLRRELALSEYGLKALDMKLREDVQWVQANVPVTSLKAQLFCQKWGAEKMNALLSRILLNFQARAFFKWRDYLVFLQAKAKADKYLKCKAGSRLTTLMASWEHKMMARAWVVWTRECQEEARNEKMSSAIEIQRLVRGFLARTAVVRHQERVGATHIQRIVRGFLGRRFVARRRTSILEHTSATLLQRAYRGFAGRRLARILFQSQAETRGAMRIQRAFRAYQQKLFARAVAQTTRLHAAATTIQSAGRRLLAVREAQRRRHAKLRETSARLIQRVARGMLGRRRCAAQRQQRLAAVKIQSHFKGSQGRRRAKRVRDEKAVKRLMVRRERAALRIQAAWRGKTGRYAYHVKLRAKKEKELQMQLTRHKSAVRIQAVYRGYKCRLLCAHLSAERAFRRRREQQQRAALKIQALWRGYHGRLGVHLKKQAKAAIEREEKLATVKIQSIARGKIARQEAQREEQKRRREIQRQMQREAAATTIQSAVRGKFGRKRAAAKRALYQTSAQEALSKLVKHAKEEAAIRIQCCARGYLSRQKFRRRLREHKAKLAQLEVERREANAVIRIQCALRKKKATKILAQRRMEFQKRIAMMASEKATEEIARLRRQQEEELAAIKMQLIMEKHAIEQEAVRLREEVERRRADELLKLTEEQKQIASDKLAAMLEASHTEEALEKLRQEENKARELQLERARIASAEEKSRREAEEAKRRREEDAAIALRHNISILDTAKSKDMVRKQEEALAKEKEKTLAQTKSLKEHHAAVKLQGWLRKHVARRKLERIKREQQGALDALKNEQERAVLKAKQEKEQAKLKIKMLLEEETRAQEQEARELELMLKQKELREKQRLEAKKHRDLAARKIQAAGKGYVARRTLKDMQRQMEFERKKREKAHKDAMAALEVPPEDEWVEYWDENAQASYYFNIRTQEASWTKPGNTNPNDVTAQLLSYSTALSAQDFQQDNYGAYQEGYKADYGYYDADGQYHYYDKANDGWAQYTDEESGAAYYYNHVTGERYWV
ncbi:hypothetical protein AeRB84_014606 [Aphanomyces euteiches]|nr:hypothetical protein AeRB84_014606 [Aphanomyces euteiches]